MDTIVRDVRYALRVLRARPAFTTLAVLCLALGIGANAAIFSVVNGVLLRSLPFPAADRLIAVTGEVRERGSEEGATSPPDFVDWRAQSTKADLAAYSRQTLSFRGADLPERLEAAVVSSNLFRVLRTAPALGRGFLPEEELPGHDRVAVLSNDLWQREFGGDRGILGKTIRLDATEYTVVGVMPSQFEFPIQAERTQLWVPLTLAGDSTFAQGRGNHFLHVVGRLASGATVAQAQAEVRAIAKRLEDQYPATNIGWSASVSPLQEQLVGGSRQTLLVLAGAVGFLLLIACANVANLMLARATMRAKEVAVRTALGAGRMRIVRQLLVESVILALLGGALGLLVASWGTDLLLSSAPTALPRVRDISVDWRVVGFTLVVSVLTGLLFGVVPALQVTRSDLHTTLKDTGRASTGPGSAHRVRSGLVIAEVALSLMLLAGAGLMGASLVRLQSVDPGFRTENVLTARIDLSNVKYQSNAPVVAFYDRLLERARTLPGVDAAGVVSALPLSGRNIAVGVNIEGERPPAPGAFLHAEDFDIVSPDYFRVVGIPLRAGRAFTAHDDSTTPRVVVVNEAFAKKYWPNQSAVGKRLSVGFDVDSLREVVGVVGDVRRGTLDTPPNPAMYVPLRQDALGSLFLAVRTRGRPSQLASALRREVTALDPDLALSRVQPLEEVLSSSLSRRRFTASLLGIFAGVALALSAIGIFGVMTTMVTQRTREIGIRMALGAQPRDVRALVVRQGATLAGIGLVIGLVGAVVLSRLLTGLLYGVSASDPVTLAGVALLLGSVALAASYFPARRATRVDPLEALRSE
jgi:putative ABC transport system permease protein